MKHVLTLLLDRLGIAQTEHMDEQDADLAVALACLRSDYEDLKARVDEYDLLPAKIVNAVRNPNPWQARP